MRGQDLANSYPCIKVSGSINNPFQHKEFFSHPCSHFHFRSRPLTSSDHPRTRIAIIATVEIFLGEFVIEVERLHDERIGREQEQIDLVRWARAWITLLFVRKDVHARGMAILDETIEAVAGLGDADVEQVICGKIAYDRDRVDTWMPTCEIPEQLLCREPLNDVCPISVDQAVPDPEAGACFVDLHYEGFAPEVFHAREILQPECHGDWCSLAYDEIEGQTVRIMVERRFGEARLTKALNRKEERQEAAETLRSLIEKISLTPGPERGEIYATLHGELGTILNWTERQTIGKSAKTIKPAAGATGLSLSVVAGARNHLNLRLLSTYRRVLEQVAMADHRDLFRAAA